MTLIDLLTWALASGLLGGVAVVAVYCLVRGASFAYFRTKLEFLKDVRKLKQGDN